MSNFNELNIDQGEEVKIVIFVCLMKFELEQSIYYGVFNFCSS